MAGTTMPLTLNRLGARRCLIAIKEWHWSTAVVCGAWMRGSVREAGNEILNKSKPFCIQVHMLKSLSFISLLRLCSAPFAWQKLYAYALIRSLVLTNAFNVPNFSR
jgi:hypothetical protein